MEISPSQPILSRRLIFVLILFSLIIPLFTLGVIFIVNNIKFLRSDQVPNSTIPKPIEITLRYTGSWFTAFVKDGKIFFKDKEAEKEIVLTDSQGQPLFYNVREDDGLSISPTGRYVFWRKKSRVALTIFDRVIKQLFPLQSRKLDAILLSEKQDILGTYEDGSDALTLIDMATQKALKTIPLSGAWPLSFSPDDSFLLLRRIKGTKPITFSFSLLSLSIQTEEKIYESTHPLTNPYPVWLPDSTGVILFDGVNLVAAEKKPGKIRKVPLPDQGVVRSYSPLTSSFEQLFITEKNKIKSLYSINWVDGGIIKVSDLADFPVHTNALFGTLSDDSFWMTKLVDQYALEVDEAGKMKAIQTTPDPYAPFTVWAINTNQDERVVILYHVNRFTFRH